MRYLRSEARETYESDILARYFGRNYHPGAAVTLRDDVVLDTRGVVREDLDGALLHIDPETVSWAFLDESEAARYAALDGLSFGALRSAWPTDAPRNAHAWVGALFGRGLVRLDGIASVDHQVMAAHNTPETHLVELLLTEKCNLACTYCLAGATPKMPTMSAETARRAVDLAFGMEEATNYAFQFSGGEPFLQFPLMQEVVAYILEHPRRAEREVMFLCQSNATLLDEERVEFVKRHHIGIGISVDGDPASHDVSRPLVNGRGSFDKVIRGLDLLQRAKAPFGLMVVLSRANVGSVDRLIDFLVDNAIEKLKINPIGFLGAARDTWDGFGLSPEEVIAYFQEFAHKVVELDLPLRESHLSTMMRYVVGKQRSTRCMRSDCGAGRTFQTINAKGDVYPCSPSTQSPGLRLGHVSGDHTSLSQVGAANPDIIAIRDRRPRDLDRCSTCSYRQLCQAGCSVQAYERYGTVRHRSPECTWYETMYPYLMRWLAEDERAVTYFDARGYFGQPTVRVEQRHLP